MRLNGNTVLITGGAVGIGLALTRAFVEAGNEVLICGRREHRLREAQERFPGAQIRVCDLTDRQDRIALFQWATSSFPALNIVINNAGIQRPQDFVSGADERWWMDEIATNMIAPIHLCELFVPWLLKKPEAAIVNVTSKLAFRSLPSVPVYCATKAAMHSFTVSLRAQLEGTSVKVFEVLPPLVQSELHDYEYQGRMGTAGLPASDVAEATLAGMRADDYEIMVGPSPSR